MRGREIAALALMVALGAWAGPSEAAFPAGGTCTGDGVRLRSGPGTKWAQVEERSLDRGDTTTVLGEVRTEDGLWYEVGLPGGDGRAWISGRYLEVQELGPIDRAIRQTIHMDLPLVPDEARARFGAPTKEEREEIFDGDGLLEIREWPGLRLAWIVDVEGTYLQAAEVHSGAPEGISLGGIRLGDGEEDVVALLGEPGQRGEGEMSYSDDAGYPTELEFGLAGGRVARMSYVYRFD